MQEQSPGRPLTPVQLTRLDYARRDLESARSTELSQLPPDGLVLLIALLIRRLDDVLAVFRESHDPTDDE